ncbi:protocatechuate 3,4-dioxygenase alpha subunit [Tamaricihabitans halophyticus]|uniref:Protocatechuate 3,4-dioxygenase alpha subunit n=1 Tax=Tamaricihabitans halophyticus TaxID=1262583 RepID=A0A4R2PWY4_9PSEU|nr:protocatechuate 3,4-dioxygenase subunit alpha [Tamaricihabitans halophyticus]TCP40682.1 protocatechuate 3,4-dioxygenase alpha subunit [Tamaricihabitans halophyticus]
MTELGSTPAQTVGPYLAIGLPWPDGPYATVEDAEHAVWIRGIVYDGAGVPVPDALVETWQADQYGRFASPADSNEVATGFRGFGRCPTDLEGLYGIRTVRPGPVREPDGVEQAPHIDVAVFARGLLHQVVTRIYFPENERANAADPVLTRVPMERRDTLIARIGPDGYRFDVRLQGAGETVFFDV